MQTSPYWDDVAEDAEFTHPINEAWITRRCRRSHPVLDYGCGYGRTLKHLQELGYFRLFGVDPSVKMIERADLAVPEAELHVLEGPETMFAPESFVMVLLIAVLTCVPDSDAQQAIIAEIDRVLAPGGYLYISDFMLQSDERNKARYREFADKGYRFGVFDIDDGKTAMRHHEPDYFADLVKDFDLLEQDTIKLKTMNGNPAVGTRMLLRKG